MTSDHVAVVTGGASGIGLATARKLAGRGVAVAVADVNAEAGAKAAKDIEASGGRAMFVRLDVADRAGWAAARDSVEQAFGVVDILINNAGVFRDRSLLKLTEEDWDVVQDVNLKGSFLGSQTMFPGMKAKKWGRIVNTSSSAHRGSFGQANYAAAKAGLIGLTRTLALEGARNGILVNAVAPHNCNTPLLQAAPAEIREEWLKKARMGRFAEPEEVAVVIDFFASDANTYVTGQLLEIDGADLVGAGW